jgi:hypothetical protein
MAGRRGSWVAHWTGVWLASVGACGAFFARGTGQVVYVLGVAALSASLWSAGVLSGFIPRPRRRTQTSDFVTNLVGSLSLQALTWAPQLGLQGHVAFWCRAGLWVASVPLGLMASILALRALAAAQRRADSSSE